jgi:hypothetical protein
MIADAYRFVLSRNSSLSLIFQCFRISAFALALALAGFSISAFQHFSFCPFKFQHFSVYSAAESG